MKYLKKQSGQATMELLVLLIGFVCLFLGLVFVCGLSDGDIGILLAARNNAELTASGTDPGRMTGLEFGGINHGSFEVYDTEEKLVFSPQDYAGKTAQNTIHAFPPAFSSAEDSVLSDEHKDYKLQAEMKAWKNFRESGNGLFNADFVVDLADKNALDAAELVSAVSSSQPQMTTVSGRESAAFYSGAAIWLGLRISGTALINARGNRVFMPVFSPQKGK